MANGQQAVGAVTRLLCFEKFADVKPAKWLLSGGYLTIRWLIGRILIGDKDILSGCTSHPDKRYKGTFGAG